MEAKSVRMRRSRWGIALFWLSASAAALSGCTQENSFIETPSMLSPQSPEAARIANLSWFMFILGGLIWLGVMAYLAYAIWGNRGESLEEGLENPNRGSRIVVFWGIGFTTLVLLVLFGLNIATMAANNSGSSPELIIDVIGRQWWWEVQYPQYGFETANEIRIPVGERVLLRLTTKDVIHSFWVPELSGKVDTIPNRVNELTLMASQAGEYWGECAEYCGLQHALMKLLVIAEPQAQFAAWLQQQQTVPQAPEDTLAFEGEQIFLGSACVYCHTIEGTNATGDLGPDLTHLASRRTLGAGILENTPGNLAGWIIDAQAIKPGNQMPPMDLSGPELQALLAYLALLE